MERRTSGSASAVASSAGEPAAGPQLHVGRELGEEAERRVVPGQDPGRAPRDLGEQAGPLGARLERCRQLLAPQLGVVVGLEQHVGHGTVDGGREPAHPVDLVPGVLEHLAGRAQRGQLEDAGAGLAQGGTDAEEFVLGGEGPGDQLAVDGAVSHGARGGEAEGAGADGLEHNGAHGLDVLGRGRLVAGAPLAHDVGPHRRVRDLGADVDRPAPLLERVEILGEGLPLPLDPLGQRRAGDVLDALHEADEPVVAVGLGRREPDAAVAHDERRDAVPRRRGELGVPGDLAVVVGVDVDPSRGHQEAAGLDDLGGTALDRAHVGDAAGIDRDIGCTCRRAGSVDECPALDDQVVHGNHRFTPACGPLTAAGVPI